MKMSELRMIVRMAIGLALVAGVGGAPAQAQAPTAAAPAPAASSLGPQQLVEDSAKRMLQELDANRNLCERSGQA
jgi:hypothetical protein